MFYFLNPNKENNETDIVLENMDFFVCLASILTFFVWLLKAGTVNDDLRYFLQNYNKLRRHIIITFKIMENVKLNTNNYIKRSQKSIKNVL